MSSPEPAPSRPPRDEAVERAALKERVYATFTGLAIVLVQNANAEHTSAARATVTLLVGIVAIALAGFAADLIAHLATHGRFPRGAELTELLRLTGTAIGSAAIPLLVLLAAVLDWIELQTALTIASVVYLAILGVIGYVAVRRTGLSGWKQLIAMGILVGLGALVVVVQQFAHGH
ncbi:hypothetical protein [Microbacterium sp. K41]|uniref:hypothetical protein n=1 Tax=Microbacterium sp. K41 TaxID=2305437 RepID=UPI00109C5CFE|nr:hypothetical protein [Microbacterium sp. K41]